MNDLVKQSHIDYCNEHGLFLQNELQNFLYRNTIKKQVQYKRWDIAFTNWLRNAVKFKAEREARIQFLGVQNGSNKQNAAIERARYTYGNIKDSYF